MPYQTQLHKWAVIFHQKIPYKFYVCTVPFISAGNTTTLNYRTLAEPHAISFKGTQRQTIWDEVVQGRHPKGNLIFSPMPTTFLFNKAFLLNRQKSKQRLNATEDSEQGMQVISRYGANTSFCFLEEGGIQMRIKQSCYSLVKCTFVRSVVC